MARAGQAAGSGARAAAVESGRGPPGVAVVPPAAVPAQAANGNGSCKDAGVVERRREWSRYARAGSGCGAVWVGSGDSS